MNPLIDIYLPKTEENVYQKEKKQLNILEKDLLYNTVDIEILQSLLESIEVKESNNKIEKNIIYYKLYKKIRKIIIPIIETINKSSSISSLQHYAYNILRAIKKNDETILEYQKIQSNSNIYTPFHILTVPSDIQVKLHIHLQTDYTYKQLISFIPNIDSRIYFEAPKNSSDTLFSFQQFIEYSSIPKNTLQVLLTLEYLLQCVEDIYRRILDSSRLYVLGKCFI